MRLDDQSDVKFSKSVELLSKLYFLENFIFTNLEKMCLDKDYFFINEDVRKSLYDLRENYDSKSDVYDDLKRELEPIVKDYYDNVWDALKQFEGYGGNLFKLGVIVKDKIREITYEEALNIIQYLVFTEFPDYNIKDTTSLKKTLYLKQISKGVVEKDVGLINSYLFHFSKNDLESFLTRDMFVERVEKLLHFKKKQVIKLLKQVSEAYLKEAGVNSSQEESSKNQ